jgi:putative peptidoglycan lipid II flippase
MLFAYTFGSGWIPDRFFYAFQVPNLFRRLLGEGALAAVFVPTFSRTLEQAGRPAAWTLLSRTLALLTVALVVIAIAIEASLLAIWWFVPVSPETVEARALLLGLTALMLPFMVTICVVALFSALLNCLGSFVPAALVPVVLNLCMIVTLAWIGPAVCPADDVCQAYVLGLAVVAAGVLQLLVLLPVLRQHGVQLGWQLRLRDPAVQRMLRLLFPVMLGQGVLAVGVFLDAQICILLSQRLGTSPTFDLFGWQIRYPLQEGALSAITYAQRLYQFPLGVLVISLATAAMPTFSRLAAREDWTAWGREVREALRLAIFEGLLAGVMMIVVAQPIVRLLFEYREFTAADTVRTAHVLVFYGVAMWAYCAQHIVLRGFYSLGDVKTPLLISSAVLPLNVLLTLVLIWVDGIREAAFALSSAVTAGLAVGIGLWYLRRRTGVGLAGWNLLGAVLRMVLAAAIAGTAVWSLAPLWRTLGDQFEFAVLRRATEALAPLATGVLVYLGAAWLLRLPEPVLLLARRGGPSETSGDSA